MTPDRDILKAASDDLCYVIVEITDDAEVVHSAADQSIHFCLEGEGEILAVGSGDPTSTECYVGDRRSTYHGRCLVVLTAKDTPGAIRLREAAADLATTTITVQVV